MTNDCYNDLRITGPEAELARFMAECFTMETGKPRFDFDKLIPVPAEVRESTDGSGWSCANWGTKWNADDTKVSFTANGSKLIKLHFVTAWSIPWPIYENLAERFPLLTIEGEIFAPGMAFGGHIRCQGGKIDYEDESEQIEAEMAELHAKLNREQAAPKDEP